jgi:hypothetical protein
MSDRTFIVTERVFLYAIGATMLVSLMVALGCGVFALIAMHELETTRDVLALTQENAIICREALLKSEARRDQIEEMLEMAAGRRKPLPMGGE